MEPDRGFGSGTVAVNPRATGTFTWSGIRYLRDTVTYTSVHGDMSAVGGALIPLSFGIWIVATVLVGRLWRVRWTSHRMRSHAADDRCAHDRVADPTPSVPTVTRRGGTSEATGSARHHRLRTGGLACPDSMADTDGDGELLAAFDVTQLVPGGKVGIGGRWQ
jgi:hypothetical protein